jgi:hypothetical protein
MITQYSYQTASFSRTFDCYDHGDCFNFINLHDQLKLFKHGYSKVTDHASREIRHGRISRDEGLSLVRHYELQPIRYSDLFCEWLGVTKRGLQFLVDQHRNPKFWEEREPGKWNFAGWSSMQNESKPFKKYSLFNANNKIECDGLNGYITVGKGWSE